MYHNGFSVRVLGGEEGDNGYVAMRHGQTYQLRLSNTRDLPCDASIAIDGKSVGVFRVEASGNITLERSEHDYGHFTFYDLGTPEAQAAALHAEDAQLGLISVTFTPGRCQKKPVRPLQVKPWYQIVPLVHTIYVTGGNTTNTLYETGSNTTDTIYANTGCTSANDYPQSPVKQDYVPGGTGLSSYSGQEFVYAAPLVYDHESAVSIHLRLASRTKVAGVRPLQPASTPVPPPVG